MTLTPSGVVVGSYTLCLAAGVWGLSLCHAKAAGAGGLGELLGHIGHGLLQRRGINSAAGDGLPGYFPVGAGDGVHALGVPCAP